MPIGHRILPDHSMDQTPLDPVIVIPVHNRLDATRECLDSLQCQAYRHFQVVLVDDGSTDGTFDYIKEKYPEIILLRPMKKREWITHTRTFVGQTTRNMQAYLELIASGRIELSGLTYRRMSVSEA
jgi:cellulose synthase/poly-beta-1,6-N-acetylglucosamine synthase-like glycosyltransferase